jgi:uncharacterized membrane protein YbhN (UPF0104 family)
MNRKRALILVVVVAVLAALVYLQVREWRRFDWAKFREGTEGIHIWRILLGVLFVYAADFLRAIRWKIFLRPTRPRASWISLIAPQYVGFTGLALLGRPGEFVRPYLIARREGVSLPSQLALWFVERAFDIGAVTIIVCIDIFALPRMRADYPGWRIFGYALAGMFAGFVVALWALFRHGPPISAWVCRQISRYSQSAGSNLEKKIRAMAAGLHAIKDVPSFIQAGLLSLVIWVLVAFAYRAVTHAYPVETGLPDLDLPEVILLMGASIAGGVIQLPVVGGGSQLATIAVLSETFGYSDAPELAVSCGILLWLVTFMSVVPAGLVLAHREHLSLRRLTAESEAEIEATSTGTPSLPVP